MQKKNARMTAICGINILGLLMFHYIAKKKNTDISGEKDTCIIYWEILLNFCDIYFVTSMKFLSFSLKFTFLPLSLSVNLLFQDTFFLILGFS